ncbi:MAG: hypothetical protein Crog4KO_02050 [Crocinitomicaceae bacterium]
MKYFSIPEPCSENWNEMSPTEKGAFCQKCSKEVYDVSHLQNNQIIGLLASETKVPCMRMMPQQEQTLNADIGQIFQSRKKQMQRAMLFSLLVVFGFTLFSCNSPQQIHERNLLQAAAESIVEVVDETAAQSIEIKKTPKAVEKIQEKENGDCEIIVPEFKEYTTLGEPALQQEVIIELQKESFTTTTEREVWHTAGVPMMVNQQVLRDELIAQEIDFQVQLQRNPDSNIPESFSALTFPNPATTDTRLEVQLPNKTESLGIRLLSLTGEVLQEINDQPAEAGVHEFQINLMDLKPAYYLIDVRYNDQHEVVRLSKAQ